MKLASLVRIQEISKDSRFNLTFLATQIHNSSIKAYAFLNRIDLYSVGMDKNTKKHISFDEMVIKEVYGDCAANSLINECFLKKNFIKTDEPYYDFTEFGKYYESEEVDPYHLLISKDDANKILNTGTEEILRANEFHTNKNWNYIKLHNEKRIELNMSQSLVIEYLYNSRGLRSAQEIIENCKNLAANNKGKFEVAVCFKSKTPQRTLVEIDTENNRGRYQLSAKLRNLKRIIE